MNYERIIYTVYIILLWILLQYAFYTYTRLRLVYMHTSTTLVVCIHTDGL